MNMKLHCAVVLFCTVCSSAQIRLDECQAVAAPQTLTDVKLLQCTYSYIRSDSLYQNVSQIVWIKKSARVITTALM